MERFFYENFTDETIIDILDNINNDCYEVLSKYQYGKYQLNIYNDRGNILICISDENGSVKSEMSKKSFISCIDDLELEKILDHDIYYNYIENEKF